MSERELTPDEEAEISRLLADAASPVAMPAEVSARLDDVLAGLVAEREAAAPVVPLRSRRWPQVLVAAAAVALAGFVGANFVEQQGGGSADVAATSEAAGSEDSPNADRGGAESDDSGGRDGVKAPSAPLPTARVDGATQGLASLRDLSAFVANEAEPFDRYAYAARCGRPDLRKSVAYEVHLKGNRRAVVAVQRVNASAAKVFVYPCGQSLVPVSARLVLGVE